MAEFRNTTFGTLIYESARRHRRALNERAVADDTPAAEIVRETLRRCLKVS